MSLSLDPIIQLAAVLLLGSGIGVGGVYSFNRRRKTDTVVDAVDSKSQQFIDNLRDSLDRETVAKDKLQARLEVVDAERTQAILTIGGMETHVKGLEHQVKVLSEQVTGLTTDNNKLMTINRNLEEQVQGLKRELHESNKLTNAMQRDMNTLIHQVEILTKAMNAPSILGSTQALQTKKDS